MCTITCSGIKGLLGQALCGVLTAGWLVGADGPLVEEKQSLRLSELGITGQHVILQAVRAVLHCGSALAPPICHTLGTSELLCST